MTTHRRLHALALALGLCLATAASAQTVGYNIRTGYVWVDNPLGAINDYGRYPRDPFRDQMHGYSGPPPPLLLAQLDRRAWEPADVYSAYAHHTALARPGTAVVPHHDAQPRQQKQN